MSNLDMTSTPQTIELSVLNDDECKRIVSVIERDFKLRQKEYERIEELKKVVRLEHEHVEHLAGSKEFNFERCIRCYKPFKMFFNPRELCFECQLFVCHNCAINNKETKKWICKTCLKLKELEFLTSDWFYLQIEKKYKRCGSAKVVRELYKRQKQLAEIDEDLGYGPVPTSSIDNGSVVSYVVHDKNIRGQLGEYSKRLSLLVDNLQSDLSEKNTNNNQLAIRDSHNESLKVHKQQIASEISRARIALSGPLRRSNVKSNVTYESDLQNLLIQQTEKVLRINLQQYEKTLTELNSTNFDKKLAQIIFDKCLNKEISQIIDSSSTLSRGPSKAQQQSSIPSSFQLTGKNASPQASNTHWEMKSPPDSLRRMDLFRNPIVDEEDTEKEEEEEEQITPTESNKADSSSIDDELSKRRFIETKDEAMRKSNERVDDWRTNFTLMKSKIVSSDEDEQVEYSTWL